MFTKKDKEDQQQPQASVSGLGTRGGAEDRVRKLSKLTAGLVAVAVAGAGLGAYGVVSSTSTADKYEKNAQEALVASADIKTGEVITSDKLSTVKVPESLRTSGALSQKDLKSIENTVATVDIGKNEQVTKSMTANPANQSKLSAAISPNQVTVTIDTDTTSGMAGLLRKGDHVWLSKTVALADGSYGTQTVVSDCEIVALGGNMSSDAKDLSSYTNITVAVTSQQASLIAAAQKEGGVTVALLPAAARSTSTSSADASSTSSSSFADVDALDASAATAPEAM